MANVPFDDKTAPGHGPAGEVWNVAEIIERVAARQPAALALIAPGQIMSYREFVDAIHAVARRLLDAGVTRGQTLGVSMGQTPAHLVTLLAIARIGAISVPVHAALPAERRQLAARRFEIAAIVSGRADMRLDGYPFIHLGEGALDFSAQAAALAPSGNGPDDPCWIMLSSGTSGDPKGVLRSHSYLADRVAKSVYPRPPGSRLMPMDLNFGVGFGQSLRMLLAGGTIVLAPDVMAANLAYMVRAHAVTHWLISPAQAEDILSVLEDDDIHFPSVQYLQIVGGTPNKRLLEGMFRRFSPNLLTVYGTVEVGPVAVASAQVLRRAPESVGWPLPWTSVEVVDDAHRPLPAGKTGRLRIKVEGMFNAYLRDPALTGERFHDGWYYPNDRAHFDAEGLLYIDGRQDDVFNVGGTKIPFADVEAVLRAHPAVREVAAFVLAEAGRAERLAAAVRAATPVPLEELYAWAREQLGPVCPERLFYVNDFPRTATGKILRDQIAATLPGLHPALKSGEAAR